MLDGFARPAPDSDPAGVTVASGRAAPEIDFE
jgi:hypothetical protein